MTFHTSLYNQKHMNHILKWHNVICSHTDTVLDQTSLKVARHGLPGHHTDQLISPYSDINAVCIDMLHWKHGCKLSSQ